MGHKYVKTRGYKRGTQARAKLASDTAGQTSKSLPIKHENKRSVLSCLIECLMAFQFYQTRSNTTKQGVGNLFVGSNTLVLN